MPKHSVKELKQQEDVILFTKEEYDTFNRIYREALIGRFSKSMDGEGVRVAMKSVGELKYAILTDGTYRIEFTVEKL